MKRLRDTLLILSLSLVLHSCDTQYSDPCLNCFTDKPTEGILTVSLSYSDGQDGIPVKVYLGQVEDSILVLADTVRATSVDYWVEVGHRYSVAAEYPAGQKTIFAVDGDKVTVWLDTESCDQPCWVPRDGSVDCRLK